MDYQVQCRFEHCCDCVSLYFLFVFVLSIFITGRMPRSPKWQKLLLVRSRPTGANPVTDFYSCWGFLYAQLSCISVLHLRWFALQVTELLLGNRTSVIYPEFFHAPCRKNYALDQKMIPTFFNGLDVLYHHEGDRTTSDGCRWENMMFVCLFFISFSFVTLRVWCVVHSRGA